jgi:uncharacterized membrane protein
LDLALNVAIYCFAVSMPLMAVGILLLTAENIRDFAELSTPAGFVLVVGSALGLLTSVVGMFSVFWHFHPEAAMIFGITATIAYGAWLRRPRTRD